ncbi:MAG: HEAT repeat domain-containing protein [Candidatus Eisenbacteria bacterium]
MSARRTHLSALRAIPVVGMIVVPSLVPALAAAAWDGQAQAAQILRLEDRREPPGALIPFLASPDASTRARACLAIGRILGPTGDASRSSLAEATLAHHLRTDASREVRRAAAFALGLLETPTAGTILAACLVSGAEGEAEVRAAAVEGLGRCGPDVHPAALRAGLEDPHPLVVQAALLACWKGRHTGHLERVLALTRDGDPETRWRAAYALMRMLGSTAAGRTPVAGGIELSAEERNAVLLRMVELAGDGDVRTRLQALRGLGRAQASPHRIGQAREVLIQHCDATDPRLRVEALRALAALGTPADADGHDGRERITAAIIGRLDDAHAHVRITAIQSLGRILVAPALIEALETTLASESPWERAVALETILTRAQEEGWTMQSLHLIERSRSDPDWEVRLAGATGLAAMAEADSSPARAGAPDSLHVRTAALLREFLNDDPRVAKAVVEAWVAECLLRTAWHEVDSLLAGDDEVLRTLAGEELAQQASDRLEEGRMASDRLEEGRLAGDFSPFMRRGRGLAEDSSADARQAAITLLAALLDSPERDPAADALLAIARKDPDRRLREAAIDALREGDALRELPAPRPGCRTCLPETLAPGVQESGWTVADYRRAIEEAAAAREAIIATDAGPLRVQLFGEQAPLTVVNFARLAEQGYFDGGRWHRVVPDFVIQDGCPRGDGWGGPGHAIRCEINPLHYEPGVLGMALSGKDTGGSQYFLTLSDQPHLDGRYTIFGRLAEGWETMLSLPQGATIKRVTIVRGVP